ncbi:C40 family peptidase [Myxococcaceae bacterium JPH2]|nr:C40 family peptidase [Myxococcaceae bacterium JPH2]
MSTSPRRAVFLASALSQMNAPYRWGGKGERSDIEGPRVFDCSGLVTWSLHQAGGPDWRPTHNTDVLWAECTPVASEADLQPGDLVLYGKGGDPEHVMIYVGAGCVVGATGGGHKTLTLADAYQAGARVRAWPSMRYRQDVLGFRRLPYLDDVQSAPTPALGIPAVTVPVPRA